MLWGLSGNLLAATCYASGAGQFLGAMLAAGGVLMKLGLRMPVFGEGITNGLWLVLIGALLAHAARESYRRLAEGDAIESAKIAPSS